MLGNSRRQGSVGILPYLPARKQSAIFFQARKPPAILSAPKVGRLGFWWDPVSASTQSHFQLERTIGVPFSEQRYYSRAPLQTEDHLALLEEFEEILLA